MLALFMESDFEVFLIGAAAFAVWIPAFAGMMGWVEILGIASWESVGWGQSGAGEWRAPILTFSSKGLTRVGLLAARRGLAPAYTPILAFSHKGGRDTLTSLGA